MAESVVTAHTVQEIDELKQQGFDVVFDTDLLCGGELYHETRQQTKTKYSEPNHWKVVDDKAEE